MQTFTLPLKEVIRITGGTTEVVDGVTVLTGGKIGLEHYPIFAEDYRDGLNGRIVDNFWNQEIGMESIEMFQLAMRRKMNLMMPYYNQLYLTTKLDYDPLSTVSLKTLSNMSGSQEGESTGESTSDSLADGWSRAVVSSTPQTMLSPNGDYASGGNDVRSNSTNESTATQLGTEAQSTEQESESTTSGYQGAASDLIMRYRESLLNIDQMVIAQLDDCFMQIWDNGDSFTNNRRFFF